MNVFIVIQCASHFLFQICNLSLIKALFLCRHQDENKISTPAISDFPNTSAFTLSHTVSCFCAHLEGRPGCLNSLNEITCGGSGGATSLHVASRSLVESSATRATSNYQSKFLPPPQKSFNLLIRHLSVTPTNLPQVTRRPSKPKKWLLNYKSLQKDTVQETEASVHGHAAPARAVLPRGHRIWHAIPFHFIEKDPAELGEYRTWGSKMGHLSNNSTQQIPEED